MTLAQAPVASIDILHSKFLAPSTFQYCPIFSSKRRVHKTSCSSSSSSAEERPPVLQTSSILSSSSSSSTKSSAIHTVDVRLIPAIVDASVAAVIDAVAVVAASVVEVAAVVAVVVVDAVVVDAVATNSSSTVADASATPFSGVFLSRCNLNCPHRPHCCSLLLHMDSMLLIIGPFLRPGFVIAISYRSSNMITPQSI